MSSLALMRWLEGAPRRYDAGMRLLTLGRADALRDVVAAAVPPGARVVELGCGTGALTERLARQGVDVLAYDTAPDMLDRARARLDASGCAARVEWRERTAAEIDGLPSQAFDAVVSSFAFSELSRGERSYVLRAAFERLRPGGVIAIADETQPTRLLQRLLHRLLRAPQAVLAWLLAGSLSTPIPDLADELRDAGFVLREQQRWLLGGLAVIRAERPR
jgi:demethylmenaquinone methyltransferase/2-methoxy-6-polyprenyl-1,4-benzoquinol methylase